MIPNARTLLAALSLGALSCGGVGTSRETARDQATTVTCDRFETCQGFGTMTGQTYPSKDSCQVDWRANWEKYWPAASCDGKIDGTALNTCLNRISSTDCMSLADFVNTVFVVCAQAKVCGATADGGT